MKDSIKKFLFISIWIAITLFFLRCSIAKPANLYAAFSCAGDAVSITVAFMILYERLLWRYITLGKTPKIYGAYSGTIEYKYNGESDVKDTSVIIKQSLLSVRVRITTNETTSFTITSNLREENGEYVLYYTYITNPKSKHSDDNPIQYGTCRLDLTNTDELHGIYWTSRTTKGDIYMKRSVK